LMGKGQGRRGSGSRRSARRRGLGDGSRRNQRFILFFE
jgi:hypothetical protein